MPLQTYWVRNAGGRAQQSVNRWFWCRWKFENCCSTQSYQFFALVIFRTKLSSSPYLSSGCVPWLSAAHWNLCLEPHSHLTLSISFLLLLCFFLWSITVLLLTQAWPKHFSLGFWLKFTTDQILCSFPIHSTAADTEQTSLNWAFLEISLPRAFSCSIISSQRYQAYSYIEFWSCYMLIDVAVVPFCLQLNLNTLEECLVPFVCI